MRVAILGCGYVGLELARQLRENHVIIGVRRSDSDIDQVKNLGVQAQQADITEAADLATLPDVDGIVFAASTGGQGADAARRVFVEGIQAVLAEFGSRDDPPTQFIYTSSTGVYGDHDGEWVDEDTPPNPTSAKTQVLREAERVVREDAQSVGMTGKVVRFAGLYGPHRYRLNRYLEGPVTEGYLNMIHRNDAAGILRFMLESTEKSLLVGVDDEPVDKWVFADWLADECGVERPPKQTVSERLQSIAGDSEEVRRRLMTSKRCSNALVRSLDFEFQYPTYREGYRAAIEAYRR